MPKTRGSQWNWDLKGHRYFHNHLPVLEEGTANENEDYNLDTESQSRPRSPIQKIMRECVDESRPAKSFGDYDPVQYVPPQRLYTGVKGNLTGMQRQRKVIYVGLPPENEMRARLKASKEESHYHEMDKQMNQGRYGLSDEDDFHIEDITDDEEDQGYGLAQWDRAYQQQPQNATSSKGNVAYQQQQHQPEVVQRRFQEDYGNVRQDNPNEDIGSYQMAQRWQKAQTGASSTDYKMSSTRSTWMQYTGETAGFFLPNQATANPGLTGTGVNANRTALNPEASPFEYGYSTTKEDTPSTSGNQLGAIIGTANHEIEFCDKIARMNYFYSMKKLPIEENHGTVYYGYELQFWPIDDDLSKEIVWGLRMADEAKAKDSTFAAGLEKLPSWHEALFKGSPCKKRGRILAGGIKQNREPSIAPGSGLQQEPALPSIEEEEIVTQPVISPPTPATPYRRDLREGAPVANVNVPAPSSSRNYERDREPIQLHDYGRTNSGQVQVELTPSERFFMMPQTSQSLPMSYSRMRSEPMIKPRSTETRDENFRVAIPRDPCIILESQRGRRRGRQGYN